MEALRILLVEDEPPLLALLKRYLERNGHSVIACGSAEAARVEILAGDWEPNVLIADETLPGEAGSVLATSLLVEYPGLVCILCSGYPLSIDRMPESVRPRVAILAKPYLPQMLESAIGEVLRARG